MLVLDEEEKVILYSNNTLIQNNLLAHEAIFPEICLVIYLGIHWKIRLGVKPPIYSTCLKKNIRFLATGDQIL